MTSTPPPLGDYDAVPPLNLSGLTEEQILQALPPLTEQQTTEWHAQLLKIRQGTMSNLQAREQVASVLASVAAIARSVGMILTVA